MQYKQTKEQAYLYMHIHLINYPRGQCSLFEPIQQSQSHNTSFYRCCAMLYIFSIANIKRVFKALQAQLLSYNLD